MKYVVITPARDEKEYLSPLFQSLVRQTVRPLEWIVVDDGSTDGTGRMADEMACAQDWIRVLHRKDRGRRMAGGGVVAAFYDGFNALATQDWDFVVKLDSDLQLPADYFERCFRRFADEPTLGIAGGAVFVIRDGAEELDSRGDPPFHVRGATKIYRRACWDDIGGIMGETGWDTADEVMANMLGWRTATLSDIRLLQLRPTGRAYGGWKNSVKNGKGSYVCGYHPLFMGARCARKLIQCRQPLSAAGLAYGFILGHITLRRKRVSPDVVRYLRKQQWLALRRKPCIYRT